MTALRGFEAAGRLGSFSKAAEELSMTQSAVSHQIRTLEGFLGQPLFRRVNRSAVLTDAGHDFLGTVRTCLDRLEDGVRRLDPYRKPGQVIVSVTHAFASCWLLPRLAGFRTSHPELDVWLHTTDERRDFERDEVHVSIWLGDGKWPGLEVTPLFEEVLVPLCAPALPQGMDGLATPRDLLRFTLLHDERREDWRMWFAAAGLEDETTLAGPNFSDSGLLLQAAAGGQGIALGSLKLAARDLAAGRLMVALDLPLRSRAGYHLVSSDSNLAWPKVRAFHGWLVAEAEGFRSEATLPASVAGVAAGPRAGRI